MRNVALLMLSGILCCMALFGQAQLKSEDLVQADSDAAAASTIESSSDSVAGSGSQDSSQDNSTAEAKVEYIVGLYDSIPDSAQDLPNSNARTVTMTSASGQKFVCVLPTDQSEEENNEIDHRAKMLDALRVGFGSQCLYKNEGYWSYEVCGFKHVVQYHGEKGKSGKQVEFDLGKYTGKLDESPILEIDVNEEGLNPKEQKYLEDMPLSYNTGVAYAQRYVGGDSGRKSLVQYQCSKRIGLDGALGQILSILEPKMFTYVITVATPHACVGEQGNRAKIPVQKLLRSLKSQCVYMNQGWWNYEFCYGEQVRQFHMETITTTVNEKGSDVKKTATQTVRTVDFVLGKKTANTTLSVYKDDRPEKSYASEFYSEGTTCDLTSRPRKIEVRYICDMDIAKTKIMSIQETATCEYVMIIATPLICVNEDFQPMQPKLMEIACHPKEVEVDEQEQPPVLDEQPLVDSEEEHEEEQQQQVDQHEEEHEEDQQQQVDQQQPQNNDHAIIPDSDQADEAAPAAAAADADADEAAPASADAEADADADADAEAGYAADAQADAGSGGGDDVADAGGDVDDAGGDVADAGGDVADAGGDVDDDDDDNKSTMTIIYDRYDVVVVIGVEYRSSSSRCGKKVRVD
eukprot:CAMPEP_0197518160 /NCGR_PEP_ID=MMETSP1318-20131121/3291_1 /TAXON_ID=552666 /ORGANISM="Partenskyella glossopodia, Strain RCC365" /LENGTH=632 /DNA_ID=CAMNT_0043068277 /DNA_START=36 /DNA_END=1935 /DNA_ORIENTATION=+